MRLSPGELTVGAMVTVLEAKPIIAEMVKDHDGEVQMQRLVPAADMYKGIPMEIAALNLPYVVVKVMGQPAILDTRIVDLMEISKEYIQATASVAEKTPPQAKSSGQSDLRQALSQYRQGQKGQG